MLYFVSLTFDVAHQIKQILVIHPRAPTGLAANMGIALVSGGRLRTSLSKDTQNKLGVSYATFLLFTIRRIDMGDKGSKDKGKREQQKKAQLTFKEKRKKKNDKKNK